MQDNRVQRQAGQGQVAERPICRLHGCAEYRDMVRKQRGEFVNLVGWRNTVEQGQLARHFL